MRHVIVPNSLRDAINEKLDAAIAECPGAESERDELYQQLLEHVDEHGVIPDFCINGPATPPVDTTPEDEP